MLFVIYIGSYNRLTKEVEEQYKDLLGEKDTIQSEDKNIKSNEVLTNPTE